MQLPAHFLPEFGPGENRFKYASPHRQRFIRYLLEKARICSWVDIADLNPFLNRQAIVEKTAQHSGERRADLHFIDHRNQIVFLKDLPNFYARVEDSSCGRP